MTAQPPYRIPEWAKTLVTFLFCAGFVTFGLAVMFLMPAGQH